MKDASFYVGRLLEISEIRLAAERRATWRQSIAAVANAAADEGPGPLEGLQPGALLKGIRAVLQAGLADDLDWLTPSAAGIALYELAAALPLGPERREIGRRVLSRLLEGDAETFAAIATRMARTTGKGLSSPGVRARVALVTELPLSFGVGDGSLAMALASRRELAREWIEIPSTGSLPSRRLAARLLERAAREASRRASQGDLHAMRVFRVETVQRAFARLLADRESLVWRHIAVARGLLAPWEPELQRELESGLDPRLTPTEWRRAAVSIAAETAVDPATALRLAAHAFARGAVARDGGVAVAFVWGAARAGEAEPEAAAEIVFEALAESRGLVAEAILELARELGPCRFVEEATNRAIRALRDTEPDGRDDSAAALMREVLRDLDGAPREDEPLCQQLARALATFATLGARAAYTAGKEVLISAQGAIDALEAVGNDEDEDEGREGSLARRASLALLRDLDASLLERNVLRDLLALGSGADAVRAHDEEIDTERERLAEWILLREATAPRTTSSRGEETVSTVHMQRLRALLHLVDSDAEDLQDDGARMVRLRSRWDRVARVLVPRFENEAGSPLHRTISATLARALDALFRAGASDQSDLLLVVAFVETQAEAFEILAEASMDPDVVHVLSCYAAFLRACHASGRTPDTRAKADSLLPPNHALTSDDTPGELSALDDLAREIIPDGAGRREVLRTVLVRIVTALRAVVEARSLRALSSQGTDEADVVTALEVAVAALAQTTAGARARFEPVHERPASTMSVEPVEIDHGLSHAVSRVLLGAEPSLSEKAVRAWSGGLESRIPRGIARAISACVRNLHEKPNARSSLQVSAHLPGVDAKLPTWLPPRRTLGGFYVVRPLGAGSVGSVFVVNRIEDRHDPSAERFALKVPDYSATAARSVSEAEFLQLFRDEASALMAVAPHPNLARFVTFDLSARPKPILVMELVEGALLERTLETGVFDTPRALKVLDDVLAGLEAMHSVGVGHLDVKPSNVVLRRGDEAVLVDFGLAGRRIRPGCTTGPYGAPEVWGVVPNGVKPTPMMADVYAFGCLAYETLTGKVLFEAPSEMAQIAMHLAHDGLPEPLQRLKENPRSGTLAEFLFSALRRDPTVRPTVAALRRQLRSVARELALQTWPLVS